jgi:hypothetical protein
MKEICQYWKDEFDCKRQIEKVSVFHHYRYKSRGVGIHFIHERGKGPAPIPLILTHGWPGSFLEMVKVIPMLTDPTNCGANSADAFDVIVPSLPGYGFSDRPTESGVNTFRIADIWMELMRELGYERVAAQERRLGCGCDHPSGVAPSTGSSYRHCPPIRGSERYGVKSSIEIYLQQQPLSLFTSQRHHRIHPHGPPARNESRNEGHG